MSSHTDKYLETLSGWEFMCGNVTTLGQKRNWMLSQNLAFITYVHHALHPFAAALDDVLADHRANVIPCISAGSCTQVFDTLFCQVIDKDILQRELKKMTSS